MTEYRTIENMAGYRVGDDGTVWSCKVGVKISDEWRRLTPFIGHNGLEYIYLTNQRKTKGYFTHRLVLQAFAGQCPKGLIACHKNGNRSDNRLDNLIWDTRANNRNHAKRWTRPERPRKIAEEPPAGMRQINSFPKYYVGADGTVWSTLVFRRMSPSKTKEGYQTIQLARDGKQYTRYIHRLVLETFNGPCPRGHESCHNNGVRSDNRLENLRWDTPSNNNLDKRIHGTGHNLKGQANPHARLTPEQVTAIRNSSARVKDISKQYSLSHGHVSSIKSGRAWKHI